MLGCRCLCLDWFNRGACLSTVAFFIFGNVMYSLLALFENMGSMGTYYAMIISRFIVGVSSGEVISTVEH